MNQTILKQEVHASHLIIFVGMLLIDYLCIGLLVTQISVDSFYATLLAILSCALCCLTYLLNRTKSIFCFSGVILLYTMMTQFGLVIPFAFFGKDILSQYSDYTLRFLESSSLSVAILMGSIAILTYTIVSQLVTILMPSRECEKQYGNKPDGQCGVLVYIGYALILLTLFFLLYYLATGAFRIGGLYSDYRKNVVNESNLYAYVLMLYSMGLIFIVACGTKQQIKHGLLLYCLPGLIFLLTGNKGEVMYSALAAIAVIIYRGYRPDIRLVIIVAATLLFVIPVVTSTRNLDPGLITEGINIGLFDSFSEMGMQIRVSVYVIEQFSLGLRDFLYGYSYYSPIVNIIGNFLPFVYNSPPEDYNFSSEFAGMGFSQVAESYCNFGLVGIVLFFSIVSVCVSVRERQKLDGYQLAFLGCATSILINATRNRFAFVIGQLVMIWLFLRVVRALVTLYMNTKELNQI